MKGNERKEKKNIAKELKIILKRKANKNSVINEPTWMSVGTFVNHMRGVAIMITMSWHWWWFQFFI